MKRILLYVDGASRGNPGRSSAGIVICDGGNNIKHSLCRYLGDKRTNNDAEYLAAIYGLRFVKMNYPEVETIKLHSDSKLIINQLRGKYRIKNARMKLLNALVLSEAREACTTFWVKWVPRKNARIKLADTMANSALNDHVNINIRGLDRLRAKEV